MEFFLPALFRLVQELPLHASVIYVFFSLQHLHSSDNSFNIYFFRGFLNSTETRSISVLYTALFMRLIYFQVHEHFSKELKLFIKPIHTDYLLYHYQQSVSLSWKNIQLDSSLTLKLLYICLASIELYELFVYSCHGLC